MKRSAPLGTLVILLAMIAATGASAQPSPGGSPDRAAQMSARLADRFNAANKTKDGKLTREEAAAGMPLVSRHFDEIDVQKKGYITMQDIQSFMAARMRERAPQK